MAKIDTEQSGSGAWFNWSLLTLLHTFTLGAVSGCLYAVAAGEIAPNGTVLTVYLSVLGALFAAALGWLTSRVGDALSDSRAQRRTTNIALMRIRLLAYELVQMIRLIEPFTTSKAPLPPEMITRFSVQAKRISLAASAMPNFETLIEDDDDIFEMIKTTSTFQAIQESFPAHQSIEDRKAAEHFLGIIAHPKIIEGMGQHVVVLKDANTHFKRWART